MNLEYVKCNLCSSNDFKKLYSVKGPSKFSYQDPLTYVKCNNCGLVYTNPRPKPEKIKQQYESEDYHSKIPKDSKKYLRKILKTNLNKLIFIEKYKKNGNLLEIGCASGFLLDIARLRGWNAKGVELAKRTSETAKNQLKLDVFNGILEKAPFNPDYFDVITAFNIIEHLNNPSAFLSKCYELLKKEGILIIETPSLDSLHYAILKKRWDAAADPGQHLYLFNKKTLKKIVKKSGFKIKEIKQRATWNSIFSKTSVNEGFIRHWIGFVFRIMSILLRKQAMIIIVGIKR